ncbi:MAG TPA: RDD family protein [Chloroflexota bacterium]|nr:RDD family protein [Chloroflexota bacterium]
MITFLAWATVIYAIVLVLVLAVSLIAIFYYLWSIGTTLGKISGGLAVVRQQTAPLGGQIEAINGALTTVGSGFGAALDDLADVNSALGGLVGAPTQEAERVA